MTGTRRLFCWNTRTVAQDVDSVLANVNALGGKRVQDWNITCEVYRKKILRGL
jgi:hypothetical protein